MCKWGAQDLCYKWTAEKSSKRPACSVLKRRIFISYETTACSVKTKSPSEISRVLNKVLFTEQEKK